MNDVVLEGGRSAKCDQILRGGERGGQNVKRRRVF